MRISWLACLLLGLGSVLSLRADTIVLRSGEHIEGQIISETASDVSIRRKFKTGNILYVDKISREKIARIERSAAGAEPQPEPAEAPPETRPAGSDQKEATAKIPDKPAFLEEAIRKYLKPDYRAAGIDLSRLIVSSSSLELQSFSAIVQERLKLSLAELAATAHFKAALDQARGRAVNVQYVTEYEKPALIPMLEEAYERAITMQVGVSDGGDGESDPEADAGDERGRPAAGQAPRPSAAGRAGVRGRGPRGGPTRGMYREVGDREARAAMERGGNPPPARENGEEEAGSKEPASRPAMNIKSWLDRPTEFNGNRAASAAMEIQIYHARSLLSERIRLDPQVRTDKDLKEQLTADRVRLDALLKAVKARAGGALTPREREAQEAYIRNQWDAHQREMLRRQNEALMGLQRIIEEQQRQQQMPPGSPPPPRPQE